MMFFPQTEEEISWYLNGACKTELTVQVHGKESQAPQQSHCERSCRVRAGHTQDRHWRAGPGQKRGSSAASRTVLTLQRQAC